MCRRIFLLCVISLYCDFVLSQEPRLILPIGHTFGVSAAVFSPDGKKIVTTALDNTAKIWDVNTGRLLADLKGHTDTIVTASFSPDGKKFVTAGDDGGAKIWDAVSTNLLVELKGHTGKIYTAAFSPDGKKIVTASGDHTAKIWDVISGKLLNDLIGHTKVITSALFSRDGKKIVTASDDNTSKVWDVLSGNMLADLIGHNFKVLAAEFSPDGKSIITASGDSTVKIWDAIKGILLTDIKEHRSPVRIAHFSPDGKKFVTASDDGFVRTWNFGNKELLSTLKGKANIGINPGYYPDIVRAANFSPDGKKILTIYRDSATKIWDVATGKLLVNINRENIYVNSAQYSPDGKKIALALAGGNIEIWDADNGKLITDLKGGANYIISFEYNPDGKRIFISNWFGAAKVWDANRGTLVANLPGKKNSQEGVYIESSPDGKKIVSIAYDNKASVWDAVSGALSFDLIGHKEKVYSARFTADGKKIFTSSSDSTWKIWDAGTGNLLVSLKGEVPFSFTPKFSPDGKKIITLYNERIVRIWNAEDGQKLGELKGHNKFILNAIFSPDGKKILTYSADSTVKIWNAETGTLATEIKKADNGIRFVLFSPDGKKIIVVYNKTTTTRIFETESGALLADLKVPAAYLYSYQFSPDNKSITIGLSDGTIKTWDMETGRLLSEIKAHSGPIFSIRFSPDRKKIVSASEDGTAKVWDSESRNLLLNLKEHTFRLQSAGFSPDGKNIVTVSSDHTAKVWDAETGISLYTFISVNDEDYLVIDKNHHFDGTESARKLLYFTCGTEIVELEQVKDQLWIPNLAERILNGETINAAKLSDLNICNLTPLVDTIQQSSLQYRFRIKPRLGGLGVSIVYVNGIEAKRYTPRQLQLQNGEYQLSVDKKELRKFFIPGTENSITVKALTAKNSFSSRTVSIHEKVNSNTVVLPNLYALVVGVSDYKGEDLDLKFAAKDAVDIASAIDISAKKLLNTDGKEHVFIYKIHTDPGRDKFPEKNSIRQAFTEIAGKAQPHDILLIFFAGHGVMESLPASEAGEKNQFYFLTADASNATVLGALKDVGISTEEISDWIKPQVMKAQKRILIFDACNSGQVIKEMISIGQKGQNFLASRSDEKGKQIKAIEKLNERSGMFILSASASDQKAYEMGKYNQGTLTYSLLRAIKEQPDILEERRYLNISRWFNAAERSVGELARETGAQQQPQVVSTTNFNIGVVDEEVRNRIVLPFEKPMFTRSDFRNIDLRIDNLKLRTMVDKELDDISGNDNNASILYNPGYDGANVYAISGDYTVTGNNVIVSVILTKGGTDIRTKFEVKGMADQPEPLSKSIINTVMEWFKNNNE